MASWFGQAPPGAPPAAPPAGAPPAASSPTLPHQFIALPDGTQAVGDLTQNPDGSFTVANGTYGGLQLDANRQPVPASLTQVQAVQKAQSQPGGLPPGSYSVNPDGTLTITSYGSIPAGTVLNQDGMFTNPDGTPLTSGGQPLWNARTPAGDPATKNPNYKSNLITDIVTKDNPIAGGVNAIGDVAGGHYKKAASDLGAGASGGTLLQVDANGNIVPGDTTKAAATDAGVPNGVPGVTSPITGPGGIGDELSSLLGGLKGLGGSGSSIDTSAADAETARANALADALGGQAGAAGAQADTDRGLGAQTRGQQQDSIAGLTAAANGTAPSAAELQLKQQAGIDASRQYGLAAALQGSNPGAALRQASLGAAQIAGTTNQDAGVLRANEQATARGQLATTLANVRAGDQGAVNTDVGQQNNLTGAEVSSQGQGVTSTGQKLAADAAVKAADAQKEGAELGALGTLGAGILTKSDKRAKKNIVKSDLADALAKGVHGVEFTYRPEVDEDEEPHFGILADALEKVIPGVVRKGPSGLKEVHTGHLTLANTGMLSELARRLQDVEKGRARRG